MIKFEIIRETMKKKIILIAIPVLLVVAYGVMYFSHPQRFCELRGGKYFYHSFNSECEFKAKDAGKQCVFDNECSKGLCLYTVADDYPNPYPDNLTDKGGQCTNYLNNKDGVRYCHRAKNNNDGGKLFFFPEDGSVHCELFIS
jgi:hypothetical protein